MHGNNYAVNPGRLDLVAREDSYISFWTSDPPANPSAQERMRILNNGWVGIGTPTPGTLLSLFNNNSGDILRLQHSSSGQGNEVGINFNFGGTTRARIVTLQPTPSAYGNLNFYTTGASGSNNRLTIRYDGNVGIGNTNPTSTLLVQGQNQPGSAENGILSVQSSSETFQNGGGSILLSGRWDNDNRVAGFAKIMGVKESAVISDNSGYLSLYTKPTADIMRERIRITSSGNVGIGTAGSDAKLQIYDSATLDPSTTALKNIRFGDVAETNGWLATGIVSGGSTGGPVAAFAANGGTWWWGTQVNPTTMNTTMRLEPTGNLRIEGDSAIKLTAGGWAAPSDIRLKRNVQPIKSALERILMLHGVEFEWNEPEHARLLPGPQLGMIAQEVEEAFPQWVETGKDGYKLLTFRGMEALTVEAMRELKQENERIKAKNAELEERITELEAKLK